MFNRLFFLPRLVGKKLGLSIFFLKKHVTYSGEKSGDMGGGSAVITPPEVPLPR